MRTNNVDEMNGKLPLDHDTDGPYETTCVDEPPVVSDEGGNIKETQCGLGSWRPTYLRPFGTIWSFTAAVSMLWVIAGISFTYYSAVIPQIERRFGLSSSLSGFIRNVDNVGYMVVILAVSHLGRYANKPRILAASSLLSAFSILVFAVPHFIYGCPGQQGHHSGSNASTAANRLRENRYDVCDGLNTRLAEPSSCEGPESLLEFNEGAVALFIFSQLMLGVALSPTSSLTMTYMDDNARDQSPKYFGAIFGVRSFAPILGFLLAAWTNSIYVDLSDPGIDEKDPRWIGAWWLGFVVCAACIFVWALPLSMFPPQLTGYDVSNDVKHVAANPRGGNFLSNLKDVPRSVWRVCCNPVYLCIILGACSHMTLVGFATFLTKYLQAHFGTTAAVASICTGVISTLSWSIGPIIGGPLVSRMKITVTKALCLTVIFHVISFSGYLLALFVSCSESPWAGTIDYNGRLDPSLQCNVDCSCDATAFQPVCGSDGRSYFSPCFAGCHFDTDNNTQTEFYNCRCIERGGGRASLGACVRTCETTFYFYVTLQFITFVISSVTVVPLMTSLVRCVEEKDKAMSLAVAGFLLKLAGFPSPAFYGAAIDTTCLVQQVSCERKGACLLYDNDAFRVRLHVLPIVGKFVAIWLYCLALFFSVRRDRRQGVTDLAPMEMSVTVVAASSPSQHQPALQVAGDGGT